MEREVATIINLFRNIFICDTPKCDNLSIYIILQKTSHETKEFYKLSIIPIRFYPIILEESAFFFHDGK